MQVKAKSIEPVKSDQGLTITYVASSQQLGELEVNTPPPQRRWLQITA
jgi:hypothetical protein